MESRHSIGCIAILMVTSLLLTSKNNIAALAHASSDDDIYRGYFIPKDSIVIGNAWFVELVDHEEDFLIPP